MSPHDTDRHVRFHAFDWLGDQVRLHGDVLDRTLLSHGFELEGQRVPLIGPQGIFKPRLIPEIPLSITTTPGGPYDDSFADGGLLSYRYRGNDPQHHENARLRRAMTLRVPLIYFHGILPGRYMATWPVYIVGDQPSALTFTVAVDDAEFMTSDRAAGGASTVAEPESEARRAYITATVRRRLHQRAFRERVLEAYRSQCALCRLRHEELLDAAHIIPDSEPEGEPQVRNGLALCKLHHAAYNRNFLGIRPDYVIVIRDTVMSEEDGPMLKHGLQGLDAARILLPNTARNRPDPALLQRRYEQFRAQT